MSEAKECSDYILENEFETMKVFERENISVTRPTLKNISVTQPNLENISVTRPTLKNVYVTRPNLENIYVTRPTLEYIYVTRPTLKNIYVTRPTLENIYVTRPTYPISPSKDEFTISPSKNGKEHFNISYPDLLTQPTDFPEEMEKGTY